MYKQALLAACLRLGVEIREYKVFVDIGSERSCAPYLEKPLVSCLE